jgi:hypothetical protein
MWPMEAVFTDENRGGSTIDKEMQSSRRALLYCFSTLKNDLVVLVSRRDTVKAELASLSQKRIKHSCPPREPGYRTRGIKANTES